MTLKDLVPPMELCKQIPEGNFDNSAMAWFVPADTDFPEYGDSSVIIRNYAWAATSERGVYPAPTLAEIVSELTPGEDGCGEITQFGKDKRGWFMMASFEGNDDGYGSGIDTYEEKVTPTPPPPR